MRLKVDDGDLVTEGVAFDNKMLIVPFQEPQKLFQKLRKDGIFAMHQEVAGSG